MCVCVMKIFSRKLLELINAFSKVTNKKLTYKMPINHTLNSKLNSNGNLQVAVVVKL